MRPDTEPNIHAKRIMAGAFVIVVLFFLVPAGEWAINNYPAIGCWATLLVTATVVSYAVGTVVLGLPRGESE